MWGTELSEGAMMAIVNIILWTEITLAVVALVVAAIRAFGPKKVRNGLVHSIREVKHFVHL